jgi:hypothetical protein
MNHRIIFNALQHEAGAHLRQQAPVFNLHVDLTATDARDNQGLSREPLNVSSDLF